MSHSDFEIKNLIDEDVKAIVTIENDGIERILEIGVTARSRAWGTFEEFVYELIKNQLREEEGYIRVYNSYRDWVHKDYFAGVDDLEKVDCIYELGDNTIRVEYKGYYNPDRVYANCFGTYVYKY